MSATTHRNPTPKPPSYSRHAPGGGGRDRFGTCRTCGERVSFTTDGNGRLLALGRDHSVHRCKNI